MKSTLALSLLGLLLVSGTAVAHPGHGAEKPRGRRGLKEARQSGEPPGASTVDVPRPLVGDVPYGTLITRCTVPGVVALTFDDGPGYYTETLLDLLARHGAKATFFMVGSQYGPLYAAPWADVARRVHGAGHQIGHHTWSHQDLSAADASTRQNEVVWNEMAFREVLGFFPTYIRPPYGSCTAECRDFLGGMGYHVVNWSLDTDDWRHQDDIQPSVDVVTEQLAGDGHIVLSHDIHRATVERLAEHMILTAKERGLRPVTLGECLGDPPQNWYRAAGGTAAPVAGQNDDDASANAERNQPPASATPPATSPGAAALKATTDGMCGGQTGQTCTGSGYGRCCSRWGWCGEGAEWCGAGCQNGFGTC